MSDAAAFSTAAVSALPDPDKRVRYSLGQVLGADDLEQEQFYFVTRDRQHNRSLHGYGTASGLALSLAGTEVRVEAGLALTPAGCVVGVPARQCADFAAWVAAHAGALRPPVDDAGTRLAHVVLRYRECETDRLPMPVTPCCGEGEGTPTRITESFRIEFTVDPPPAAEEAAVGRFGRFLRGLRAAPAAGTVLDLAGVALRVRSLIAAEAPGPWVLPPDALDAAFELAFRLWITEVRPQLHPGPNPPLPHPDDGVLLGTLRFRLEGTALQADTLVLDESRRPLLLATRALQELRGQGGGVAAAPPPAGPQPGLAVIAEQAYGLLPSAGTSAAYARADHTHGTPPLPPLPNLAGDVIGVLEDNTIARLQGRAVVAPSPENGEVLTYDLPNNRWVPRLPPGGGDSGSVILGGDAEGPAADNTVTALQGRDVDGSEPDDGDVLTWSKSKGAWLPLPAGGSGLVTIVAAGRLSVNGAVGLTLGQLELVAPSPLTFSFDGYRRPNADTGFNYVVKAIAVVKFGQPVPVIGFSRFTDKGIELTLGIGDKSRGFDSDMEVMVEVTEIRRAAVRQFVTPVPAKRAPRKTRGGA
jgi:hypothetical protein